MTTKTNNTKENESIYSRKRIFNFLKDDIEKLKEDIKNNNKEEIESFFSYWGHHLKQLK